ncbi:MAG: hypothetical protein CMH32_02065 [Micavibrio sp.]|nr:hypothetical protein [Micavibrio sp.]|tara:strand:+ start:1188 stop:2117 length:930 start_codon:yes stop_codon:yes gene_type:complete
MAKIVRHFSQSSVLVALNFAILMWGLSGVFGKWVEADAYNIAFWRMAVAFIFMAFLFFIRRKKLLPDFDKKKALINLICGGLLAIHWFSFFTVIQMSTIGLGIIFHASFVFMVAIFEPIIFRFKPKIWLLISALIGSGGLIFTLCSNTIEATPVLWGYGIITALSYAILSLINRSRFLVNEDPFDSMSAQLFYGALLFLPFSLFGSTDLFTPSTDMLGRLLLLGLFATAIGHSVYFWSLRYVSATKASLFTLLEPVYGIAFGMLLFKEYPDQTMMMGASIVIITAGIISLFSTVLTDENDEILNETEKP